MTFIKKRAFIMAILSAKEIVFLGKNLRQKLAADKRCQNYQTF